MPTCTCMWLMSAPNGVGGGGGACGCVECLKEGTKWLALHNTL